MYHKNLEEDTINNKNYRSVKFTTDTLQFVFMSLNVGEEIGSEVHPKTTQFIRIEKGRGIAIIAGKKYDLIGGSSIIVKPGTIHNIINTSKTKKLKLYTIYSPPEHKHGLIQKRKPKNDVKN